MGVRSGPKIPTRGPEFNLVLNGTFDSTAYWSATSTLGSSGTWGISSGVASIDGSQSAAKHLYASGYTSTLQDLYYRVTLEITAYTAGTLKISAHTGGATSGTSMTGLGTYSFDLQCTGNNSIYIMAESDFNGSIDNVSMVQIESDGSYVSPLVLCLDAMNAKSFAGEPAVNLRGNEDFSTMTSYTGLTVDQVAESESPSGYAGRLTLNASLSNSSARSLWGSAGSTPTSGNAWLDVWVKGNMKTRVLGLKPSVFCGNSWHTLLPLDGGSVYITPGKYRRFGLLCSFGTSSGGPNPGFSMTNATGYTSGASGQGAVTW